MNDRSLVMVMTNGIGAHLTNDEKRAHLTDLKREHLIDQVCVQEILPPRISKQHCHNGAASLQQPRQMSRRCAKSSDYSREFSLDLKATGNAAEHSVFVRCAAAIWWGIRMKSAIEAHLPDEHFVIRVDGRVKSHHRRFLDALREGLQLRDQFPQHDIKVQSMKTDDQQRIVFALIPVLMGGNRLARR